MAIAVVLNGIAYSIPETGEESWGEQVTDYLVGISSGTLQKTGGAFTLTADVNFGPNFGLVSRYFTSRTVNPSTAGALRLAVTDSIGWRNNANDGNLLLSVNASNELVFSGTSISNAITQLTGDVTAVGPGVVAATIAANAVTDAKFRQSAALSVVGNATNALANVADITAGTDFQVLGRSGTSLAFGLVVNANIDAAAGIAFSKLASLVDGNILVGSSGNIASSVAVTGDVTLDNAGVTAIGANKVTLGMLAQISTQTFLGRTTASTGNVEDLTATQATAILNAMVGDSGSGGTKGLVPAPASGDAAAQKYLKADGTWDAPSGAGTVSSVAMTVPTALFAASPVAGSPVTGAGTLAPVLATQSANTLFSGPTTGSAATPTFRASVPLDVVFPVSSKTTTYGASNADGLLLCSGSAFTVTLPAATSPGYVIRIKKTDSSFSNIITIARAGSDTIEGATSTTLNTLDECVTLVSDGTATWYILCRDYPLSETSFTPTYSAGFGTVVTSFARWARCGNRIRIRNTFTTGTIAGSAATVSLPSGLTMADTAPSNELVGYVALGSGTANAAYTVIAAAGNTTSFAYGRQSSTEAGLAPANGSSLFGSTQVISYWAEVPISGWN